MAIKDDAEFQGTLNDDQKAFFTTALKTASDGAVTKFKTDADEARKKSIPESYTFKFGEKSHLDQKEDAATIAAFAKEHGLTQEQAQKYLEHVEGRAAAVVTRQLTQHAALIAQWKNEVTADKEIGGDKLAETLKVAKRATDRFAPKDSPMAKLLDETGYGNHPLWVRLMWEIGKTMKEDDSKPGGDRPGGSKSWGSRLKLGNQSS